MSHHLLLILHLIGAAVWAGGHLVLALGVLPGVLRDRDPAQLLAFESKYEKVGMPSLVLQVVTGVWMAVQLGVGPSRWFHFADAMERGVSIKLALLLTTICFALSARLFVIPRLTPRSLPLMAFHIICVTTISVAMLVVGSYLRYGGI